MEHNFFNVYYLIWPVSSIFYDFYSKNMGEMPIKHNEIML